MIYLDYPDGKTRKPLNFVYLTNYDYVVDPAIDTDGDTATYNGVPAYKTVSAALTAAGSPSTRKVILIREGSYDGRLEITGDNISLIGEDAENTIIHWNSDTLAGGTMGERAAVRITGSSFSAENLTIQNDWEYQGTSSAGNSGNESCDALHNESDKSMFVNVRLLGYQDTLCINKNTQYYNKCYIAGNVDFIYGNTGQALILDSDIVFRYNANKNSGYLTAMQHKEEQTYGIVISDSRITAEANCSGSKYYLGRPWNTAPANVVIIDTYMSSIINKTVGWTTWSGAKPISTDEATYSTVRYYEFGNYGAGYQINLNRRQISPTAAAAKKASVNGWDAFSDSKTVSSDFYVGTRTTNSEDKTSEKAYNSDVYSQYEGDDTGLGKYNQEGYAEAADTYGGGLLKEENSNYYAVNTAEEFLTALVTIKNTAAPSVIEVKADLNMGSLEVDNYLNYSSVISEHAHQPLTHPTLKDSGVSKLALKEFNDLTIFSSNGSSIKHCAIDISKSTNILIRNIAFDELWEWDEETSGDYDINDWDYITIQSGSDRVWIDHCTFYKAYDGIADMKTPSDKTNVTVSWCEFLPGSENNTFFNVMMNTLAANPDSYPYYKSLLDSGMSKEQIWWYAYGQKKTSLLGQNDEDTTAAGLRVTYANDYFYDSMDRMPRLRRGKSHVYNSIMDAQELYDARKSISNASVAKHIVSNGASSTCGGEILVENSYINGVMNPLNSGNGSSPVGYINAVNSLYYMNGTRYALAPKNNNSLEDTTVLVTDADAFVSGLGYEYVLYDAAKLSTLVQPYCGAGKLTLTVLQWEKVGYYDKDYVAPEDNSNYNNDGLDQFVEETPVSEDSVQESSVDSGDGDDDEEYVPTTSNGDRYSEIPIMNHTAIRMVVTSSMGMAKAAAGITNDEYVEVEIDPLQGDNAAVKLIEELAARYKLTVSDCFDVNVYRVAANGARIERLTDLNAPIDLLFAIPKGWDGTLYDYGVIRVHDGVAELLKDTDDDPLTISVASDKFSAYAIVYGPKGSLVNVKAGGAKGVISKNGNYASPKTFDQSRFIPEVPETELAQFAQKQTEQQLEQEVADLLITPQATKFPFAIVIAAILALVAFIGGEVFYFRRKKQN